MAVLKMLDKRSPCGAVEVLGLQLHCASSVARCIGTAIQLARWSPACLLNTRTTHVRLSLPPGAVAVASLLDTRALSASMVLVVRRAAVSYGLRIPFPAAVAGRGSWLLWQAQDTSVPRNLGHLCWLRAPRAA